MSLLPFSMGAFQASIEAINEFVDTSAHLDDWPLCGEVLRTDLEECPPWVPLLPILACSALGGEPTGAVPVAAAWMALRKAAHLIDAVQDGDKLPQELDTPQAAIHCALALVFGAFRITSSLSPPEVAARVTGVFAKCGFDAVHGYNLSLQNEEVENDLDEQLDWYWRETILKSGSIYRAAILGGALLTDPSEQKNLNALGEYGYALGVTLQILDDCRDMQPEKRLPFIASKEAPTDGRQDKLDHLTRLISPILLAWTQRGQEQLARLETSPALELLAEILKKTTVDDPTGEKVNDPTEAA